MLLGYGADTRALLAVAASMLTHYVTDYCLWPTLVLQCRNVGSLGHRYLSEDV